MNTWSTSPHLCTVFEQQNSEGATFSRGAYSIDATTPVEGGFLELAIEHVKWLQIQFPPKNKRTNSLNCVDPNFPHWILKLRNLRGIDLKGYSYAYLPDDIGPAWPKLQEFHAYGSGLIRLPRSVGQWKGLTSLHLYTSYKIHFLPLEILHCSELRRSKFSTRALFANHKNDMPVPPLVPWWLSRDLVAVTYVSKQRALEQVHHYKVSLPSEIVQENVLPFLSWEYCSVCGDQYEKDFGFQTWSRQRVATDTQVLLGQVLLGHVCSPSCARRVNNQLYYDPTLQIHVPLQVRGDASVLLPNTYNLDHAKASWSQQTMYRDAQEVQDFYSNVLNESGLIKPHPNPRTDWTPEETVHFQTKVLRPTFMLEADMSLTKGSSWTIYAIEASGDLRSLPRSNAPALGRIDPNMGYVLANQCVRDISGREWVCISFPEGIVGNDKSDREWAALLSNILHNRDADSRRYCWTAIKKRNGHVKLREMELYPL